MMENNTLWICLLVCLFTGTLTYYFTRRSDVLLTQSRVYEMFGEGDHGEEVNYWIQTGDTIIPRR